MCNKLTFLLPSCSSDCIRNNPIDVGYNISHSVLSTIIFTHKKPEKRFLQGYTQNLKYLSSTANPLIVYHHFIKQSYHWYTNVQCNQVR